MRFWQTAISFICCLAALNVQAAGEVDDNAEADKDVIAIFGSACEKEQKDEAKAIVRVRVTDKASFLAVSEVPEVSVYRDGLNEHDFNVMVYSLVDDSIDDMSVTTTKQDVDGLCVEVKGYLHKSSIYTALNNAVGEEEEQGGANLKESMTQIVSDVNTSYADTEIEGKHKAGVIPPSDDTMIAKHTAPESDAYQPLDKNPTVEIAPEQNPQAQPKVAAVLTDANPAPKVEPKQIVNEAPDLDDKRGLVYVEPTEFFDKSKSAKHSKVIKDLFANDENFYVTEQKDLADYIIKINVLRAKVDPINSSTNRLQMVVSVSAEVPDTKASTVEHQNRFVLFSHNENEQDVALKLMKKLFLRAAEPIKTKLEQAERKRRPDKALPVIITPAHSRQPA